MTMNDTTTIPPELANHVRAVREAYPHGVPAAEYEPLVYILCESMSMRGAAKTLELCGIREYIGAYNDIQGVAYNHAEFADRAKPVLEKLIRHGYDPTAE
jgi:hypothetical protein